MLKAMIIESANFILYILSVIEDPWNTGGLKNVSFALHCA